VSKIAKMTAAHVSLTYLPSNSHVKHDIHANIILYKIINNIYVVYNILYKDLRLKYKL